MRIGRRRLSAGKQMAEPASHERLQFRGAWAAAGTIALVIEIAVVIVAFRAAAMPVVRDRPGGIDPQSLGELLHRPFGEGDVLGEDGGQIRFLHAVSAKAHQHGGLAAGRHRRTVAILSEIVGPGVVFVEQLAILVEPIAGDIAVVHHECNRGDF